MKRTDYLTKSVSLSTCNVVLLERFLEQNDGFEVSRAHVSHSTIPRYLEQSSRSVIKVASPFSIYHRLAHYSKATYLQQEV
jgi:hypothetical protein